MNHDAQTALVEAAAEAAGATHAAARTEARASGQAHSKHSAVTFTCHPYHNDEKLHTV